MGIIQNKNINYPLAAIVWVFTFLIFYFLCSTVDMKNNFWSIVCLVLGAGVAFGDTKNVPIQTDKLLIFNGSEVKDENGDSVWVGPGWYFTFWVFSFAEGETIDKEKRDVAITQFDCQDSKGKNLKAEANGDWEIVDRDKFKIQKEVNMESNLSSLIRRSIIRVCGNLVYETEIRGKELGDTILKDIIFQRECDKYGIKFHNLIADAVSANLQLDNSNATFDKEVAKKKSEYPANHKFTHAELDDIDKGVRIKLGISKEIVTNSPMLGRFEANVS